MEGLSQRMRFDKLDLNLLIVLNALLTERSVSAAAERVHLSQSATSSALARLRAYFDDDLLSQRGRSMVLTPRAEELIQPVAAVLTQIRETIATPKPFDPRQSDREIRVMTSNYTTEVLLAPALRALAVDAPNMTFRVMGIGIDPVEQLERGLADLVITTDTVISTGHPSVQLFSDDFVVIGWKGNPALASAMSPELYDSLGHVAARFGQAQVPSFEEWVHRQRCIERRVEVVAPDFTSVAAFVFGSHRIGILHRRLAERLADLYDLHLFDPPFEIPRVRIAAQWLTGASRDPALAWLVDRLVGQAAIEFADLPAPAAKVA